MPGASRFFIPRCGGRVAPAGGNPNLKLSSRPPQPFTSQVPQNIDSSRANGAKSRGPITPESKQKSSANSLVAQCVVLDDEIFDRFFELLADLTREHNPQTETQRILVETMVIACWRLLRLWTYEREILEAELDLTPPGTHGAAARRAHGFRSLADNGRVLDLLARYESRLDRQYARALNLLMKLAPRKSTYSVSPSDPNPTYGQSPQDRPSALSSRRRRRRVPVRRP